MSYSVNNLQLQEYTFDPLEGLPDLPNDLSFKEAPHEDTYYIVQFTKSLSQIERTRLQREYNLRLTEYLPRLAFLEKVNTHTLANLAQEPIYRASIPFQPAFKIAPGIGQQEFRSSERKALEGLLLSVVLFPDADPATVVAALEAAKASEIKVLDDLEIGGVVRVQFVVSSKEILSDIAHLEQVRWIEAVAETLEDNGNTAGTMQSGTPGIEPVWDQGLHGEQQIIGVMDSGVLDINHCWFKDNINNTPGPTHRKVVGLRNNSASGANGHATFVAGIVAGDDVNNPGTEPNRGNAWAARISYSNRSDLNGSGMFTLLSAAESDGANIHTNSWHQEPTPQYNQISADVDKFVWNNENNLVLGSSGNADQNPPETIGPPGTAKNALCISAAQTDPNEMNFGDGNNGPTPDGRRKPEIFAPGCNITSSIVSTVSKPCATSTSLCATSWATPATAAAAALVRQYYTEGWYPTGTPQLSDALIPSGALLKATLLNSTIDMTGILGYPGNLEGWGLIRLDDALFFCGDIRNLFVHDIRNAKGLNTGESHTHQVHVVSDAEPLKITLVWSEPPGAAESANPVVNNLDLIVTSPNGVQTFLGNNFAGGFSAPGGVADAQNNVEMVLINNPTPGDWTVTVTATEVNVGNPGQGYALVATGDLVKHACEVSVPITLKVPIYTEPEVTVKQLDCEQGPIKSGLD